MKTFKQFITELKVPTGNMPFSNVPKKTALRSFAHGLKNPNKVSRRHPSNSGMASRQIDDTPFSNRPGDYTHAGAALSRGDTKPSRKQKRQKVRHIASNPIVRSVIDVLSVGGTAIQRAGQASENRRMRKQRMKDLSSR